ncbi:P-loop containing nucleoside triphosphate hydrolase protein [Thozetella sp. PMI_491]|nr:P-loop containing nucleoside triphosphate hydrolase protein [Thozetella sp. PMI_491]
MTDDDYMICRNVTSVYALRQKIWVKMVNFNHLSEIVFNGDPFRSLQFPSHRKQFIHRLVEGFQKGKGGSYDDVIEGKGKGLIFLLYGPPGLGKTLTAESVAEVAKRPLYHISAGELSTDVSSLEDELRTIFRMGARWNAIVLLDEADVLMSKRTSDNLTRNSVVAVFLRMLEYYRGMLFLTTNRRDDFDDAFFNRIHVTIEYSELDATSRTNIWRSHIARATKENRRTDLWTESMYEALGQIKLNGRDIKNYVRTAYAFTRAMDGEDLGLEQVVSVLRNSLSGSGVPGSIVFESAQGVDSVLGKLDELVHRSVKTMENSFGDALGVVNGRT